MSPATLQPSEIRPSKQVAPPPQPSASDGRRVSALERRIAHRLLQAIGSPPIGIVLWNGEIIAAADPPLTHIVFHDRATFWKVVLDPNYQFGEAYSDARLEIEGDLAAFLEMINQSRAAAGRSGSLVPSALLQRLHGVAANTTRGARRNIHHHYDLGNDFYRLWLDEDMVYSGAYFSRPSMTLEEAQRAKLNHVCRKLWLRPGDKVIEIGGGWGALARLLARDYGATVKSFNISHEQVDYARRRAKDEGLSSRVEFIEDDYRNASGRFDVLVSLGMLEHVGTAHYREFGRVAERCLTGSGRGLIQSIGQDRPGETSPWIERRIFPGGYAPTLAEMMDIFEAPGFSVLDVENLRLHYAETLRRWLTRFEASVDRVSEMFDERFVRMWRLYLSGSIAAFNTGGLQLFQVVFARSGANDIPQTRQAV